ncbi:hypothetical protein VQ643_07555 [Pseudomonas sp. F1_0610]|uniref:hypothetical protein n=1 Tax=Pseudomonas sp. F1_0610 TaxID=3114284 RepID=UPI0039C21F2A
MFKKMTLAALGAVTLLTGCKDGVLLPQMDSDYVQAQKATAKWALEHPASWSVNATEQLSLEQALGECREPGVLPLSFNAQGVKTTLYFKCSMGEKLTLANLPARFAYAVIDELPHGIETPNWNYRILTPASSFSESVYFDQSATTRRVRIKTPLYAISGTSNKMPECLTPADAPAKKECYVTQEIAVELNMILDYPIK